MSQRIVARSQLHPSPLPPPLQIRCPLLLFPRLKKSKTAASVVLHSLVANSILPNGRAQFPPHGRRTGRLVVRGAEAEASNPSAEYPSAPSPCSQGEHLILRRASIQRPGARED